MSNMKNKKTAWNMMILLLGVAFSYAQLESFEKSLTVLLITKF